MGMAVTNSNRKRVAETQDPISSMTGMAGMKSAVNAAIDFIKEYFPKANDILLEEIGLEEGRKVAKGPEGASRGPTLIKAKHPFWKVVISFKLGEPPTISEVMGGDPRLYREVHIDSQSGLPSSMGTWGR
jgi:hypothetical protein